MKYYSTVRLRIIIREEFGVLHSGYPSWGTSDDPPEHDAERLGGGRKSDVEDSDPE